MIKRLLKYSLISFVVSVGTYIIISKHTTEESILIGRPVDVIFILPSLQSSSYEYTNDNHIDTTRESDSMTFEVEDVFSEDIYMMLKMII